MSEYKMPKGLLKTKVTARAGTGVVELGQPSAAKLKEVRRAQTSDLARYLRDKSSIRGWSPKAIENLKIVGKMARKLGVLGIVTLPSQLEEYKEMMKPLHKKEQIQSAKSM